MIIVHLLWSLTTGGTESMLADIANIQIEFGHKVIVVVVNDMIDNNILHRFDKKCILYFCYRKKGSKTPLPIIKLNYLLWRINPDIVHVHMDGLGKYLFRSLGHFKMVRTVHSNMGNYKDLNKYDSIFSISESVQKNLEHNGFKSEIVYNGIFIGNIKRRIDISVKTEVCRIVSIGRLEEIKGHHILVEAVHQLDEKGVDGFCVDIIGDGSERDKIEALISKYSLNGKVNILGLKPRDYIYENLCNYDIFVLPSLSEGFGLTLAEAMAAKVPVVTCDLDGPMEVINNGKYGYTFICGDSMQLAGVLTEMIHNNKGDINVDEAYEYVSNNFDIYKTVQKYCEKYVELIHCKL